MARLGVMMLVGVMGGIVMRLGHCVITWLGPGAGGGIRPSSHQDSASKTPSVYGVAEYGILSSSTYGLYYW